MHGLEFELEIHVSNSVRATHRADIYGYILAKVYNILTSKCEYKNVFPVSKHYTIVESYRKPKQVKQ